MDQININLISREDRNGRKYYIANPNLDIKVNLNKIVFFIFVSEDGEESLVIRTRQLREERFPRGDKDFVPGENWNGSDPEGR
jgi:hypothetical protein